MEVKKENQIKIHFDGLVNFKLKRLLVDVQDVKGIYDLRGNMMHENKAEFYIQNFIQYSEKTKSLMGGLGAVSKQLESNLANVNFF